MKMICPQCGAESSGQYCPECGARTLPAEEHASSVINLGDANAISGGIHTTTNTTNNVTNVAAQKTELELIQERKALFLDECKRAYEDNVLDQDEAVALEEYRIKLGLDKDTADNILSSVRTTSEKMARKSELSPIARIQLSKLSEGLASNDVSSILELTDRMEALVSKFDNDELSRKYYLALSALNANKCIELHEKSVTDNYWRTYWSYLAYIRCGRDREADILIQTLDRFSDYPEDNITVLYTAGELMRGNVELARDYLSGIVKEYTLYLQRFVDSIYLVSDPQASWEMVSDDRPCAFYLVNFFGQKDPLAAEAECKVKEEAAALEADMKSIVTLWDSGDHKKAFDLARKWETTGHPVALNYLGNLYDVQDDIEKAISYWKKSAESGFARAQHNVGLALRYGSGSTVDPDTAFEYFSKAAAQGNANSIYELGLCYLEASGVAKNEKKGLELIRKAADGGCGEAIEYLSKLKASDEAAAVAKQEKERVKKEKAVAKAAQEKSRQEQDAAKALELYNLGVSHNRGINGCPKDPKLCVDYLTKSAALGNANAQYDLSTWYTFINDTVDLDFAKAVELLQKAATAGHVQAQARLGTGYATGRYRLPIDHVKAFGLLRDSAEISNDPDALNCLACYYSSDSISKVVKADDMKAAFLFAKAAELGNEKAQFNLGQANWYGQMGMTKNVEKAKQWLSKAAEKDLVEAVKMLSGQMSDDDGKKLARKLLFKTGSPEENFALGIRFVFWSNSAIMRSTGIAQIEKAAEQGHVRSQYWMGHLKIGSYEKNLCLPQDSAAAARWYKEAADNGHRIAQFELAKHALSGTIQMDRTTAIQYLKKSAAQSYYPALELLENVINL